MGSFFILSRSVTSGIIACLWPNFLQETFSPKNKIFFVLSQSGIFGPLGWYFFKKNRLTEFGFCTRPHSKKKSLTGLWLKKRKMQKKSLGQAKSSKSRRTDGLPPCTRENNGIISRTNWDMKIHFLTESKKKLSRDVGFDTGVFFDWVVGFVNFGKSKDQNFCRIEKWK